MNTLQGQGLGMRLFRRAIAGIGSGNGTYSVGRKSPRERWSGLVISEYWTKSHTNEVTNVTTQEDGSIWSRPDESRDVADRVSRRVQDIQTAVAEVVPGLEKSDVQVSHCFE